MKMSNANKETADFRDSSRPAGGSLGATMNQGGSYSHASADSLPALMNQGAEDKQGEMLRSKPLRSLLNQ